MIKIRLAVLLSVLAISGCQHTTVLNEAYFSETAKFTVSRKMDGAAVVSMTKAEQDRIHSSHAAYLLGSGSRFTYEIGKITKAAAEQVFGAVFAGGVSVSESQGNTGIVIRPTVKNLEWWYRVTKPGYNYQEVVKLDLTVTIDNDGKRVFDKTFSSGEVGGRIDRAPVPLGTEANRVVHQTVRQLMERAANEFNTSR
jgi:hypothetical protein